MLFLFGAAALNHLTASETWARERLRPFAGRLIRIEAGSLVGSFRITGDGSLTETPEQTASADVVIQIPADALANLFGGFSALFGAARISGAAELAETFGFVLRNLRWDAEADLARLVGDIVARRVVVDAERVRAGLVSASARLTANLAEAVTEEFQWIVKSADTTLFSTEVDRLRDDLARLEARIERLARKK